MKRKIALIADVRNWAFHNISRQIEKNLSNIYTIDIFFAGDYHNITDLLINLNNYDIVHFFWRDFINSLFNDESVALLLQSNNRFETLRKFLRSNTLITSSVYDHLLLSSDDIYHRINLFNVLINAYTVSSYKLFQIYNSIEFYPNSDMVIEDGVDLTRFFPMDVNQSQSNEDPIVIGWVGNSKWGMNIDGQDHKGLESIIKPAIRQLQSEGLQIVGEFADRNDTWLSHEKMPQYYNSIDIYVCASDIEGTPNPVLEAMACGKPVISTDVGIVPQVFGKLQREFILEERSVECLISKLKVIIESRKIQKALSHENLESISSWSWDKQCVKWEQFFSVTLNSLYSSNFQRIRCMRTLFLEQLTESQDLILKHQSLIETSNNSISALQSQILSMESSKFWKIRQKWLALKSKFNINN